MRYETVEKTPEGMKPRLIEREGPTGLLVTTTAVQLHPENETRMLSVNVTDTQAQTKAVLRAQASETTASVNMKPWLALQDWLEGAEHNVTIPYAMPLAEKIPPVAVRLRRDFPLVLNLIRAHTMLHQATRQRDSAGRIIATLADYAVVRELVYDLVADAIGATVAPSVRETVEAVRALAPGEQGVTVNAVATRLELDKSAAYRRVQSSEKRGYLRNLEERKGRPARLVIGDAMPEDVTVLPTRDDLETACNLQPSRAPAATMQSQTDSRVLDSGCRVAVASEGILAPLSSLASTGTDGLDGEE